ncbi:MAG: hypothetical protein ACI8W7_005018 [Gammaproteobacteria bacterium]|jgi:hypothetical protein
MRGGPALLFAMPTIWVEINDPFRRRCPDRQPSQAATILADDRIAIPLFIAREVARAFSLLVLCLHDALHHSCLQHRGLRCGVLKLAQGAT